MEALALNTLWIGPLLGGLVSLFLRRRLLFAWGLLQGFLIGLLWTYLYVECGGEGLSYERPWFSLDGFSFSYSLSLRHTNFSLILLAVVVVHAAFFYGYFYIPRPRAFSALLFFTLAFAQGVFLAADPLLFFVFYEASLIPAFLLILGWGGRGRSLAAVRFALFTLAGSVFLLVGLLWALVEGQGTSLLAWRGHALSWGPWLLMTVGLAVKLPLVPLHSWLGEAHVEADSAISMVLAGLLLKLGGFGLLEWVWYDPLPARALFLRLWGALSLVYAIGVATGQRDLKRLVAFTSIAHMGFVGMGAGAGSSVGLQGAYHQLFTHGIVSSALFAWVGWVEKRAGSRSLSYLGGVFRSQVKEQLQAALLFFGAIGAPGLALFVSEVLVIAGVGWGSGWEWAFVPALSLPLTGWYFLRAYRELTGRGLGISLAPAMDYLPLEAVIWLLLLLSVLVGVYPRPWLSLLGHVGT